MPYVVRYSTLVPSAAALNALAAKSALEIAREASSRGHEPVIEKDGEKYDLRTFERLVSSVKWDD